MTTRILFGDIHNHNAQGCGLGSMERSIDIVRTHLDFFASRVTPPDGQHRPGRAGPGLGR